MGFARILLTMRVAVIGDVAGQLGELRHELRRLGAEPDTGWLPDDLTVIQVGDLVHRGPDSEGVVALVDECLRQQPGQWIQLVGNHEAQYLRHPVFRWPERIGEEAVETLRRWWANGQMRAAASVITDSESFLITHAGMTADFWRQTLSAPSDVQQAEAALNSLIGADEAALFRAGHMLGGKRKGRGAGPIWAATATELVPGWMNSRVPFSQIHGHTTIFDWQHRLYRAPDDIAALTTVDEDAKHETVSLNGGRIIGVDPGHGLDAARPWRSWEIQT